MVCGIACALAMAFVMQPAAAQTSGQQCSDIQMLAGKCEPKKTEASSQQAAPSKYPNAKRKQPTDLSFTRDEGKAINVGMDAANTGDVVAAAKALQPIIDSGKSAYATAVATVGLAMAKFRSGDTKGAIILQKQAIDSGALDNDRYFQGLESLAHFYIADEDYKDALATLDIWSQQSGVQSADIEGLKGNAYYRLQQYPQAVAAIEKAKSLGGKPQPSWDQIEMASYFAMDKYDEAAKLAEPALARDPNNATLLQNVIAIYINSHQFPKALTLLDRVRANGQIKGAAGYLKFAAMYDDVAQNSDDRKPAALKAVDVIKEGITKGVVQPGFDAYKALGDSYALANDYRNAVDAYTKAAPQATTGEVNFHLGQMLARLNRDKEARDVLKAAIAKGGFKRVGAAYLTLGNVELSLKDKAAAIAAYKQAEQDPETRDSAQRTLKQMGHK